MVPTKLLLPPCKDIYMAPGQFWPNSLDGQASKNVVDLLSKQNLFKRDDVIKTICNINFHLCRYSSLGKFDLVCHGTISTSLVVVYQNTTPTQLVTLKHIPFSLYRRALETHISCCNARTLRVVHTSSPSVNI